MLSSTTVRAAAVTLVLAGTALLGSGCTAVAGLQRDATQVVQNVQKKVQPQVNGQGPCPSSYPYWKPGYGECCTSTAACVPA